MYAQKNTKPFSGMMNVCEIILSVEDGIYRFYFFAEFYKGKIFGINQATTILFSFKAYLVGHCLAVIDNMHSESSPLC